MVNEPAPVRIAVAGAGYWGRNLVRNFAGLEAAELVRVVDPAEEVLARVRAQYPGVDTSDSFEDALADDVDAVVIASPAPLHHSLSVQAMRAGKHVFVEKPLALSGAEGDEIVRTAAEHDRVCMVGHLLEYHPVVEEMKRLVDGGEIGDLRYVYTQRVNLGKVRSNENALWSLAPHDISVILTLIDAMPTSVTACGQDYLQNGIEDVAFMALSFEDGRMAHAHVSWLDPHKARKMTVVGSKKMLVFDDCEATEKLRIYDKGVNLKNDFDTYAEFLSLRSGDVHIPAVKLSEPLRTECLHFLGAVRGQHPARSDAESGRRVVRILEAATESLRKGGQPVSLLETGSPLAAGARA